MKPDYVKSSTYIHLTVENNDKDPKFEIVDHGRISKYKNIFGKVCASNWSEEFFVMKKVKNTVVWTYIIEYLVGEEIVGTLYEKELQKTNQTMFMIKK